jgi:hypothetical protein
MRLEQQTHAWEPWHIYHCFYDFQDAPQPDSRPAPFLHSMLRLRDGPWAQALLPKLVEQGSAAAVALTCSQMRDLCCSSRRSLKLGGLLERTAVEPGKLKSWVQDLPKHFPNCSAVSLELGSNMSFHGIPYVLPALARWVEGTILTRPSSAAGSLLLTSSGRSHSWHSQSVAATYQAARTVFNNGYLSGIAANLIDSVLTCCWRCSACSKP